MRYLIQFADRSTKRISEEEGKAVAAALASSKPIILRGAYINPRFISAVKPISKEWFSQEFVVQQEHKAIDAFTSVPELSSSDM